MDIQSQVVPNIWNIHQHILQLNPISDISGNITLNAIRAQIPDNQAFLTKP